MRVVVKNYSTNPLPFSPSEPWLYDPRHDELRASLLGLVEIGIEKTKYWLAKPYRAAWKEKADRFRSHFEYLADVLSAEALFVLLQNVTQIRLCTCLSAMNRSLYRQGFVDEKRRQTLGGFSESPGILHLASFKDKRFAFVLDTERGVVAHEVAHALDVIPWWHDGLNDAGRQYLSDSKGWQLSFDMLRITWDGRPDEDGLWKSMREMNSPREGWAQFGAFAMLRPDDARKYWSWEVWNEEGFIRPTVANTQPTVVSGVSPLDAAVDANGSTAA